jgi:hypothetical protein
VFLVKNLHDVAIAVRIHQFEDVGARWKYFSRKLDRVIERKSGFMVPGIGVRQWRERKTK